jgi:hypothetical protein
VLTLVIAIRVELAKGLLLENGQVEPVGNSTTSSATNEMHPKIVNAVPLLPCYIFVVTCRLAGYSHNPVRLDDFVVDQLF